MKKYILFAIMMLATIVNYAQFYISGTVLTTLGAPVAGQQVYIATDSALWNSTMGPIFSRTVTTNGSGAYTDSIPTATKNGHAILVRTANCTGPFLVNSHTFAGANITSNFTKCVPPSSTISGQITIGSAGAANAKVYLIEKYTDTSSATKLAAIDSALTNSSGNYSITKPASMPHSGAMLLKAFLLPASSSYSSYVPTYYTSSAIWSGAVALTGTGSITANITLIPGTNPGGPGFIGGDVVLGANKSTGVGDPLPFREILLANASGDIVGYTYSDGTGKYGFSNLAYGTYQILGDVGGKTSTPLILTISASKPVINYIRFEEKSKTFNAYLNTAINNVSAHLSAIVVYPNPVATILNINGLDAIQGDKAITITDIAGKQIYHHVFGAYERASIDVHTLTSGLYILHMTTEEGTTTMKFTK